MTPIKKALELINKFEPFSDYESDDCFTSREKMFINAKQCALIAVDEILNTIEQIFETFEERKYWFEVKQEINDL